MRVGNVDLMPKGCNGKSEAEVTKQLIEAAEGEKARVLSGLDNGELSAAVAAYFKVLTKYLEEDDSRWKDMVPGRPLIAQFASKARIDPARLKTAYIHCAESSPQSPFREIHEIFDFFARA